MLAAKGVDLTRLLGDIKEDWGYGDGSPPAGSRGGAQVRDLGDEVPVPQKLKLFCETTHNICIKIQQTTVAVTRVDILNDITSKILGDMSPLSHRDRRPCLRRWKSSYLTEVDIAKAYSVP